MVSTMTNAESMKIPEGYKQTEVGVIPEDWYVSSLQNVCRAPITYGIVQCGPHINNGVPYIRVSDMNLRELDASSMLRTSSKISDSFKRSQVEEGDIVYALRGKLGEVRLVNSFVAGANLTQGTARIAPSKIIYNKYLFWILQSSISLKQSIQEAKGSTFIEITLADLKDILVPVPKLVQEQTAIANALSDVDNLIASLETLIAKKSAIKTAAMQQLLTGKKRLPGFEGKSVKESEKQGAKQSSELDNTSEAAQAAQTKQAFTLNSDLYKESGEGLDEKLNQHSDVSNANNKQTAPRPGYKQTELGEIPEDWEVKLLGDLCSYQNGTALEKYFNHHDGYKVISIGNYSESGRFVETNNFIDREHNSVVQKFVLNKNDLSMILNDKTAVGTIIGRVLLVEADDSYVINQRSMRLTPNSLVLPKYLHLLINSNFIHKNIVGLAKPGTQIYVNTDDVTGLPLILPKDIKEQTAIASVLTDMDTELDALQQRLSKTQKIKQGMMQELLTGKTRLV